MDLGFVTLLRLAWVAGTLPIVLASLPIPGSRFLHRILTDFAARGKIRRSSSWMFTVPQSYFLHFYVVAVVITTLLVLCVWFYAYSIVAVHLTGGDVFSIYKSPQTGKDYLYQAWRAIFVLLLMEAQVLRRLYESINVFDYSSSARMHVFGYLTGLFFYTAAPLSLCFSVALEALSYASDQIAVIIIEGQGAMPDFEFQWWAYARLLSDLGWCQWIGAAGFIWGWCHQLRCHAILGSLREHRGADEYAIPHGDWFEYVSCAHYAAEIVIYASMLIATGALDITVWFLFVFVVSNLVFAAAETHQWYQQKFDSYPKSRHAIVPFIY